MKYIVTRTSMWYGQQPCPQAYMERIDNGNRIWCVDINTIEELKNFINEVGHSLVIDNNSIEIYDDYRE